MKHRNFPLIHRNVSATHVQILSRNLGSMTQIQLNGLKVMKDRIISQKRYIINKCIVSLGKGFSQYLDKVYREASSFIKENVV